MEFERAALLRDQIYELRATLADGEHPDAVLDLAPAPARNGRAAGKADGENARGDGAAAATLAREVAAATTTRAARSPARYGGGRRRR
jgi:hypothetical protein